MCVATLGLACLQGVFLDTHRNSTQEPAEPSLGGIGVTVTWRGPAGILGTSDDLMFTTTNAFDGSYLVEGFPWAGSDGVIGTADDINFTSVNDSGGLSDISKTGFRGPGRDT